MDESKRRSDRTTGERSTSRLHDVRWVATALAVLVAAVGTLLSVPLLVLTSGGQSGNPVVVPVTGTPPATFSPAPTPSSPRAPESPSPSTPGATEAPSSTPTGGKQATPPDSGRPESPSGPAPTKTPTRPSAGTQVTIDRLSIALSLPPSPGGSSLLTALGTVMTPAVALITFLLGRRRGAAEAGQPDDDQGPERPEGPERPGGP
ncbi:hypothetical protein ACGF4C_35820 [Streptomyces sp. NPDC048197]|uniref:hypothetical protein n=1 Tax=Streptomyces sp. NPDC048197 TaxID=3365511 RepID=UPI0037153475